jgi:glycerol-3-phosphate dehydrogenase (NAD(P)+)
MSDILRELFPQRSIAVLSGPNLAIEVAQGLPSATVVGCSDLGCAGELQQALGTERLRIYTTDETAGVELGGALKNVFALGAGMSDGLGFGDNSKAALVTRSLAELVRLGTALGGSARTFYGLSGAGDLMATAFSRHSRNRRVGEELGQGRRLDEIVAAMRTVAEGIPTSQSAFDCARRAGVETPIIDEIYAIIHQGKPPREGLRALLQRDLKSERS